MKTATPKKKVVAKKKPARKPTALALRKKRTRIVQSPIDPSLSFVVASEMSDDAMIEAELMGEVLPYFVYQFENRGNTVTGLSVKGVNEVARRLNRDASSGYKIRINPQYMKIERDVSYDGELGVEVSVFAEDLITANGAWGVKFEAYNKPRRDGGTYKDTFCVEKALAKAERNAKRKLIPETLATKMIQKMLKEKDAVKTLDAPKTLPMKLIAPRPKPTSIQELQNYVLGDIQKCIKSRNKDMLFNILVRVNANPAFIPEFKKEIDKIVNNAIDTIDNQNA